MMKYFATDFDRISEWSNDLLKLVKDNVDRELQFYSRRYDNLSRVNEKYIGFLKNNDNIIYFLDIKSGDLIELVDGNEYKILEVIEENGYSPRFEAIETSTGKKIGLSLNSYVKIKY